MTEYIIGWLDDVSKKDSYNKLSPEKKEDLKSRAKTKIKGMIFKANNFKYKAPKKSKQEEKEEKSLLP